MLAMCKYWANRIGKNLQENYPWVYEHVFLPAKIRAKEIILQHMMKRAAKPADEDILWKSAGGVHGKQWKVSIIVPNFNHAAFLRERLESVYGQTVQPYEIFLMDDASTDESREILLEYQKKYPEITKLCFNEKNQGKVFAQWEKGILQATGDLIWIAESDDFCERNFLEKLLPAFKDEAVSLAFARTVFMQNGHKVNSTEAYLRDFAEFDWTSSFFVTAHQLMKHAFSIRNVIPNVSGVVFRRPMSLSEELRVLWEKDLRLCGDWAFYAEIIKGGCVYYAHDTANYYRIHAGSTSLRIQQEERYYEEHEKLACFLARNYRIPMECHRRHLEELKQHNSSGMVHDLQAEDYFHLEKIERAGKKRKKNILMCEYAMVIGGGETFPLFLSNELRRQGVAVTVLDFYQQPANESVRRLLRSDIPLVKRNETVDLAQLIFQFGIDIVHSHHGTVDEMVSYAMKHPENTAAHVITLHGMYETKEKSYVQAMLRNILPSCSAFVYIADKNLKPFQDYGVTDFSGFHKIGNGLPEYVGTPIERSAWNIPKEAFVLCQVSRAIPEKGWKKAIEAVTMARETSGAEIHLLLVGSGEVYDELKGHVPSYIHLPGFQSDVRAFLSAADVGLLATEYAGESFPLMIIDCMFCGKPVIVSDIGESRNELMDEDGKLAGILLPMEHGKISIEELKEAIVCMATKKEEREILSGRTASAARKFRMETVAASYRELYGKVYEYKKM